MFFQCPYLILILLFCIIFVEGLRTTIAVGEECVINIDATEAGIGQISCSIAGDGGEVINVG